MAATLAGATAVLLLVLAATAFLLHPTPVIATSAPAPAPAPSPQSPPQNCTEFIRRSCSSTLYPSLCYSSLASYACPVAHDPTHLALAAANVTLSIVQDVYSYVSALRRALANRTVDARTAAALRDCVESLDGAADLMRQAAGELRSLPAAAGLEIAWRVSNAQTWMSAAMSYEDTCTEGFEGGVPPPGEVGAAAPGSWSVKEDVRRRVELAEQYTSNALALVNCLVGGRR